MGSAQTGILAPIPAVARYLVFSLKFGADPRGVLPALAKEISPA